MASLESDVHTSGVSIGRLEMGVVNIVIHHYKHSGMPPALSGSKPDKAGLTQTFATESEYCPITGLGGFPATECGVFQCMCNYDVTLGYRRGCV